MNEKEKIKELLNSTFKYFYPKDGFISEDQVPIQELINTSNCPSERALDYLEYLVNETDFVFLSDFENLEEENLPFKDDFYKMHKLKIDKLNSLIYAKFMKAKEKNLQVKRNETDKKELLVKFDDSHKKYMRTECINDLFKEESKLEKANSIDIEESVKNLTCFSELEDKLRGFYLPEEEVLNLLILSENLYKKNNNLFVNVYFLLLTHLNSSESFNKVSNLEDLLDLLEIYLFNNQINNNLTLFSNVLKVIKKIPENNFKLINKIINFIELLLKNVYLAEPVYKLECFNVLLNLKDKKSIFNLLINDYEIMDKQKINGIELRQILLVKLFEKFVITENMFNEQNYVKFTSKVFSFISFDSFVNDLDWCPLSRMIVFSAMVYFINTNFTQNLNLFDKILTKISEILNNQSIKNISVNEEILYKFILKQPNINESFDFVFKQLTFHFLKFSKKQHKLLKTIFKTNPNNLILSPKEKKYLIQNLKNIFLNLGFTLQTQLIDYLENLGYKKIFPFLTSVPTKKSFFKMIKFTNQKECLPVIINTYIKLLKKYKSDFLSQTFILSPEIFDTLCQFIFYEVDKSIVQFIKVPPFYLDRLNTQQNAVFLKNYSFFFPEEFISFQSLITNLLFSDKVKMKQNYEYYNCILSILFNILTDEISIQKVIYFCKEYIFYEKYLKMTSKLINKFYHYDFTGDSNYHSLIKTLFNKEVELNDSNDLFIKRALINKGIKENNFIKIKEIFLGLKESDFTDHIDLLTDILEGLINLIKNNSSEEAFTFISSNHQSIIDLLNLSDRRVKYLTYKLIFFSTHYGAILPEVSLKYLLYYGSELSVRIEECVNKYFDSLCFDEIFYFILDKYIFSNQKENNTNSISDIKNNFTQSNSLNDYELIKQLKNNKIFFKIITSIDSPKKRIKVIEKCISLLDPLQISKSLFILKSLGSISLSHLERRLIIKKIKELILLSDSTNNTQLLFSYCLYKIMIKIKLKKNYYEIKEEEYLYKEMSDENIKKIRNIMEFIDL